MTSDEVRSAVGEAPERTKEGGPPSVLNVLANKREELTKAERELVAADAALDVDAAIGARQRIDVLKGFIRRLEESAAAELEQRGQRKARAWLKEQLSELATVEQKIAAAQRKARSALDAAVAAIAAEAALREEAAQFDLAEQVLSARFGLPRNRSRASLPDVLDYGTPILRAVDGLRPDHWGRRRLVVGLIASMTDEQRSAAHRRAATEFFSQSGKELPPEVQAIMAEAPVRTVALTESLGDDDPAVIGTRPLSRSGVLARAAAEIAAIPPGVSAVTYSTHRG